MADETSMNYIYTVGGYLALASVGYALYSVSTQKGRKKAPAPQPKPVRQAEPVQPKKDEKKKKQPQQPRAADAQGSSTSTDKTASQASAKSRAKSQPKAQPKAPEPAPVAVAPQVDDDEADDDLDNAEFARQLSKAKLGTQFAKDSGSSKKKQKEKSVKQSRANKIDKPVPVLEPATSTEDDAAAQQSPDEAEPVTSDDAATPSAGADAAVADMLEPTAPGPSVLRLTDTEPKKNNKKKAKAPEVVETKKQRQNRKKAEAAKAAREEAEKERRVLEEKQRRAARIAEGRSAKDGSQYTAAAVKSSAWNQGAPAAESQPTSNGASHGFLDTFDETPAVKEEAKPAAAPAKESSSESAWMSSLPSEEEQIEMLKEEDEWSTVKTKASKRAKKDSAAAVPAPAPAVSTEDVSVPGAAPAVQPKKPAPTPFVSSSASKPQSFGSFSALTTKDETPEEEVEEEWDV